ncbi:MAG: hypothetical protein WBN71_08290 [Acidimicrobiia bacterium]
MSRRFRRDTAISLSVLMLGMMLAVLLAAPATGEVTRGECTGFAEFPSKASDKTLVAERPLSEVFLVPKKETVNYAGTLEPGAQPTDSPVPFEGGVLLKTPFNSWQVVSWGGETVDVEASGSYTYSVPSWVPAGAGELQLTAWHQQGDIDCEVAVSVQLDGDPGPAALMAAAGTVVMGAGVLAAGVKKGVS